MSDQHPQKQVQVISGCPNTLPPNPAPIRDCLRTAEDHGAALGTFLLPILQEQSRKLTCDAKASQPEDRASSPERQIMDRFLLRLQALVNPDFTASGANVGLDAFQRCSCSSPPATQLVHHFLEISFMVCQKRNPSQDLGQPVQTAQLGKPCSSLESLKTRITPVQSYRKTALFKPILLSEELAENTLRTEIVHSF